MKEQKPELQIFSEVNTNRFRFAASFLFRDVLGYRISLCYIESDLDPDIPTVSYSHRPVNENTFHIRPCHLLKEKSIEKQEIEIMEWANLKAFFPTNGVDITFDVLGAAFYLVARYEEYLPHKPDVHNRYDPRNSLAYKESFLDIPLVDKWALKIDSILYQRFDIQNKRKFDFINTIDVDSAYAYREKGLFRTAGAVIRSLINGEFSSIGRRVVTIFGGRRDPFNNFDYILELNKKYGFQNIFFFLLGDYGKYDKNVSYTGTRFKSLMKYVNDYSKVGIHPSYVAAEDAEQLTEEISRLNRVIHMPVKHSRHHYLRIDLPHTYRDLLECEIRNDYTMGYASESGYRASTCTPFFFFDIGRNRTTRLKVHPFFVMEATFTIYKNKTADEALEVFKYYVDQTAEVNGTFFMLWHNDSLDPFEHGGLRKNYEKILKYIKEKRDGTEDDAE